MYVVLIPGAQLNGPVYGGLFTIVGFADLGMEAIYEFEVKDMPVTVAVDSSGVSVHTTGPQEWQARIGKIPVVAA